ncbi:expressed unknown protein [Seminavis robusta]|uniref:Uncharacterized protein n=1 Tax=Seminavis robusta TaxID=568900 RepID=A0A9N8DHF1_9STRA|nr:expressed unknown protein [Seminavis robusta]|eukprot:Sro123_g059390.1 n/a (160) ;mRNA; r:4759-5238
MSSPTNGGIGLELRVTETSPHHLEMSVTTKWVLERAGTSIAAKGAGEEAPGGENNNGGLRVKKFQVAYGRGKSLLGVVAGSEEERSVLTFQEQNLQGIIALVDGGYNDEEQTSPERKMELATVEKYPLTIGSWTLPRQKHERPLRIEIITGALKSLLAE